MSQVLAPELGGFLPFLISPDHSEQAEESVQGEQVAAVDKKPGLEV
jgi:hypothetical protein